MLAKMMAGLALMAMMGGAWGTAQASFLPYDNRTDFNAQGTITQNYGFGDVSGQQDSVYTTHGVTYTAGSNFVFDPAYLLGNIANVLANDLGGSIPAAVNGTDSTMLAFELGTLLGADSTISLVLTTNLTTYPPVTLSITDVSAGMTFFGYVATGAGEYFTGFTLDGGAPAITNVTLGNTAVPEPTTYLLLCISLGIVGYARKRALSPTR